MPPKRSRKPKRSQAQPSTKPQPTGAPAAPTEQRPREGPGIDVTTPLAPLPQLQLARRPSVVPTPPPDQLRKCFVNHFALTIRAKEVYQYLVSFSPELDSMRARRRLVEQHRDTLGLGWLYDGAAIAFTPLHYGEEDLVLESTYQNRPYEIRIHQTNQMKGNAVPQQAYSLLFREILRSLGLLALGGKHFIPQKAIKQGLEKHKLQLWPGFYTSVENTMTGSALCIDVAHKIIRTESIHSMIEHSMQRGGRKAVERDLIGQIAITRYDHRTYRIDGIAWDLTPLSTFDRKGKPCTFVQYYVEHHNTNITDRKQPLLMHTDRRSQHTILLIPELCNMTGLTDDMRRDFTVMKDLARYTMVSPANRQQTVEQFAKTVEQSKAVQEKLGEWNVEVKTTPSMVAGRLLPSVTVQMGATQLKGITRGEFQVNRLCEPVDIPSWLFVYPARASTEAAKFLNAVQAAASGFGISLAGLKEEKIKDDAPELYEQAITKHYKNRELRVIVCMLMKSFSHSYARIKQVCSLPSDYAIPTQCVRSRTLRNDKSLQSICSKIVQQMNCKLGGDLWHIKIPLTGTMIVGIDVCHDTQSNQGRGKRSVVGFCASTNDKYSKYFSVVKFQGVGQEIVSQLAECFEEALDNYHQLNGAYPAQVIVYRDGVGEGQFKMVLDAELPQLKQVMDAKQPSMKLTMVVVQKRIHLRMFDYTPDPPRGGQPQQGLHPHARNVPSGTVMDRGCVSPTSYDFFLVNQNVRENSGTVTPTHYHVLFDEINLAPLVLQDLTFRLGHLYYNWSGAIRVPAPCQYAHKIAFLVGQAIHGVPDEKLSNLLYFL